MASSVAQLSKSDDLSTTNSTKLDKDNLLNGHESKQEILVDHYEVPEPHSQVSSGQYGSRKRMRIAVIGAGASGLNIFKVAEDKLQNVEIVCFEKNNDIGGTSVTSSSSPLQVSHSLLVDGSRTDIQAVLATFPALHINFPGAADRGQSIVSSNLSHHRL